MIAAEFSWNDVARKLVREAYGLSDYSAMDSREEAA
jgi:hypothetical protein